MFKENLKRFLPLIFGFCLLFAFSAEAQEERAVEPEMSVAGLKLGGTPATKEFLTAYSPRQGEDGRPEYFFYNKFGTQVMKLTAESYESPYFITEIEVFAVGRSYMNTHHVARQIGYFVTENGIFIGYRQSALALLVGIPNVAREDRIGPKDVVKKKGTPASRTKTGDTEVLIYDLPNIALEENAENPAQRSAAQKFDYQARYEFRKNKLKRFHLKITAQNRKDDDEKSGSL